MYRLRLTTLIAILFFLLGSSSAASGAEAGALACYAFPISSTSGAEEPNVSGTWVGSFYARDNVGSCTLVLAQNGASVEGTLSCTDREGTFGAAPQPIANGRLAGDRLTFTGAGQNAFILKADFAVKADDMRGWTVHVGRRGNYDVEFKFRRK